MLDFTYLEKQASWVWNGIIKCYESLMKGECYKLGQHSNVRTFDDPWLVDFPNFRIPSYIQIDEDVYYVRRLMTDDRLSWDRSIVTAKLPPCVSKQILILLSTKGSKIVLFGLPPSQGNFL